MAKKEALAAFHKAAIAETAVRLFQENGIEKTTMNDIAKQADYSKATLYVYFDSKDDILNYIAWKAMGMQLERMQDAVSSSSDAAEQYYAICRSLSKFCEAYPFYYESLTKTIAADPKSRKESPILEETYQLGEQINNLIGSALQNGIQQGVFREDIEIIPTVFVFWFSLSGIIQLANNKSAYFYQRTGRDKKEFLEYSFQILFQAISKQI